MSLRAVLHERCAEQLARLRRCHSDDEARRAALQVDVEIRRAVSQEDASPEAAQALAETKQKLKALEALMRRRVSELKQTSRRLEALQAGELNSA